MKKAINDIADSGRRDAMKRLMAGSSAALAVVSCSDSKEAADTIEQGAEGLVEEGGVMSGPRGTPADPDLINPVISWKNVMTQGELKKAGAIMDVILPTTEDSPGLTDSGGMKFINHWVSAPYEDQQYDLKQMRAALKWFDEEARQRFQKDFAALADGQKIEICDDVCFARKAKDEFKKGAGYFDKMRWLAMTGYYLTDAGRKDVGFIGNTATQKFDGPPMSVMEKLGIVDEQIG